MQVQKRRKLGRWLFGALVSIPLAAFFYWFILPTLIAEGKVTRRSAYEPAGRALALLCQTDQSIVGNDPQPGFAWAPAEIRKLRPSWFRISPTEARVEFGGGFHHFGYELTLNESRSDALHNYWILEFYSEDSRDRVLTTYTLNKTDHIDSGELLTQVLAYLDDRAKSDESGASVRKRINLLLQYKGVDAARASIRSAPESPQDWLDHVLVYVIDSRSVPASSTRLEQWAANRDDFCSWLLAAYAFAETGDLTSADRSVIKALTKPAAEAAWVPHNVRYLGFGLCARLFDNARFATCESLCGALLSVRDAPILEAELTALESAARSHSAQPDATATGPTIDKDSIFDPFKDIDLPRLIVANPKP